MKENKDVLMWWLTQKQAQIIIDNGHFYDSVSNRAPYYVIKKVRDRSESRLGGVIWADDLEFNLKDLLTCPQFPKKVNGIPAKKLGAILIRKHHAKHVAHLPGFMTYYSLELYEPPKDEPQKVAATPTQISADIQPIIDALKMQIVRSKGGMYHHKTGEPRAHYSYWRGRVDALHFALSEFEKAGFKV